MSTETYEFKSEFALRHINRGKAKGRAEGRVEGRAEGKASAVLTVLDARGIEVPDDARDRITGCRDLDQLDSWLSRAAAAASVDDIFAAD